MLQIILAILLIIPTLCNAQATRMSNGAAATSGAAILTGIVGEPPPTSYIAYIGNNTGANGCGSGHACSGVASIDTQLRLSSPTSNFGSGTTMESTKYAAGDHNHTLLKFDLSSIPSSATITSVSVYLRRTEAYSGVTQTFNFRKLLRNWGVSTATWNTYDGSNAWSTAGALGSGTDRSATLSAQLAITDGEDGKYRIFTDAQLTADVQAFVSNSSVNYGWHVERDGTGNDSLYWTWHSSEGADGYRPYIVVGYDN